MFLGRGASAAFPLAKTARLNPALGKQKCVRLSSPKTISILRGQLAIFGIMHVDQAPYPSFLLVDLGFDAVCRHSRPVFTHGCVKRPTKF